MADAPTWILIGAMKSCLEAISTGAGYHTDAGAFVTDEPHQVPEAQGQLIALMLEAKDRASDAAVARTHRLATVIVIGKVSTALDHAQERLHELMDDIEHAFADRQTAFPKGYQFPVFVDAKPIPPAEGMKWIGAQVRLTSHVPKR